MKDYDMSFSRCGPIAWQLISSSLAQERMFRGGYMSEVGQPGTELSRRMIWFEITVVYLAMRLHSVLMDFMVVLVAGNPGRDDFGAGFFFRRTCKTADGGLFVVDLESCGICHFSGDDGRLLDRAKWQTMVGVWIGPVAMACRGGD
jgi:hypothetical protein